MPHDPQSLYASLTLEKLQIPTLGPATVPSPLRKQSDRTFIDNSFRIAAFSEMELLQPYLDRGDPLPSFELAGARESLYFEPDKTTCAIVTCGGLCPGINNVIRSLVLTLTYLYGVKNILGFRYGYGSLGPNPVENPVPLNPRTVAEIHRFGGTMLGSSRGTPSSEQIVDSLEEQNIDILFTIGGDGTLRGATALCDEVAKRDRKISVIAIPKTIDNDLHFVKRSFGFTTAVSEATRVIEAAHEEARGAYNGIGLVQLMGRYSGFIAAHAALANHDVNFCLIPEVPFDLDGPNGFLHLLEERLEKKNHAVVVVAEGAGQNLIDSHTQPATDQSGNTLLKDIGTFLKHTISSHLKDKQIDHAIKYLDPSYAIRGLRAGPRDSEFCSVLAQCAVHAAMAGYTDMFVGYNGHRVVYVPNSAVENLPQKQINPQGRDWRRVLDSTGQLFSMTN
ncbi:MAG: ATP-dependent 6-phosphofructokinase [Verrucomicrobiota bacterium]